MAFKTNAVENDYVKGKTVDCIEWLTLEEAKMYGLSHSFPVIVFTDGSSVLVKPDILEGGPGTLYLR